MLKASSVVFTGGEATLYPDEVAKLFFSSSHDQTTNLSFLRFVPHGRGTKDLLLSREELLWFKEKIIELRKKYREKIRLGTF